MTSKETENVNDIRHELNLTGTCTGPNNIRTQIIPKRTWEFSRTEEHIKPQNHIQQNTRMNMNYFFDYTEWN